MAKINVKNTVITVIKLIDSDYISLTDIAKYKTNEPNVVIGNWMRNRNTISILEFGKVCTIRILNPSNSRGLKKKPD